MSFLRSVPQWLKITSDEVKDQIFKLAKKGLTPSQIGVILRDSHGVAQVPHFHPVAKKEVHLCRPGCGSVLQSGGYCVLKQTGSWFTLGTFQPPESIRNLDKMLTLVSMQFCNVKK